jgi:hypothetical protein
MGILTHVDLYLIVRYGITVTLYSTPERAPGSPAFGGLRKDGPRICRICVMGCPRDRGSRRARPRRFRREAPATALTDDGNFRTAMAASGTGMRIDRLIIGVARSGWSSWASLGQARRRCNRPQRRRGAISAPVYGACDRATRVGHARESDEMGSSARA